MGDEVMPMVGMVTEPVSMKPKTPTVSFVVPVYNVADYLDECLESLCGQTIGDVEVVCINDGSTDRSADVLSAWKAKDPRVKVITQQNAGVGRARNVGLDAATGEFVCFVDGDDYIDLDTAEHLVSVARREDADIVVFGASSFPEKIKWVYEMFGPLDIVRRDNGCDVVLSERGCIPSAANKLYRTSLLREGGLHFNERLILGEDTSLQFLAFPLARCSAFVHDRHYHYRFNRAGSAVTEGFKDHSDQMAKHLDVLCFISDEWLVRGYMAGRQGAFLEAIAFIFYDFMEMSEDAQVRFAQSFFLEFFKRFDKSQLDGIYPVERWLYTLMLELGDPNGISASRKKAHAKFASKMTAYRAARACKHAVQRVVKGKEEWQ